MKGANSSSSSQNCKIIGDLLLLSFWFHLKTPFCLLLHLHSPHALSALYSYNPAISNYTSLHSNTPCCFISPPRHILIALHTMLFHLLKWLFLILFNSTQKGNCFLKLLLTLKVFNVLFSAQAHGVCVGLVI